jgi:methionyl-tRNA formyltransferase
LIIWRAQAVESTNPNATPGEVIVARGDDLIVDCGEQTALRLIEVQPESRQKYIARDFINGMHMKVGERFG